MAILLETDVNKLQLHPIITITVLILKITTTKITIRLIILIMLKILIIIIITILTYCKFSKKNKLKRNIFKMIWKR